MQKIHSLTLNWNGENMLEKMLPGLLRNLETCGFGFSIAIRDNGSKDKSVSMLKDFPTTVFEMGHNRDSFSTGVNFLFDQINPNDDDIILLVNNDIQFYDDQSIKRMLEVMKRNKAAIVGARLMYDDGKTISHNGVVFCPRHGNMPWHFREGSQVESSDKKNRTFQAVTAACALVKTNAFRVAGKLDTNLRWAFEDISLNLEISLNQKQPVICCGETNIRHSTSATLAKNPVQKLFMAQNVKYFREKWYGKYQIDHDSYLKDPLYKVVK